MGLGIYAICPLGAQNERKCLEPELRAFPNLLTTLLSSLLTVLPLVRIFEPKQNEKYPDTVILTRLDVDAMLLTVKGIVLVVALASARSIKYSPSEQSLEQVASVSAFS